jgi:phosphatidylserine/phosphatidylglycerophosphate/cardiolipin synthase-like enzyme
LHYFALTSLQVALLGAAPAAADERHWSPAEPLDVIDAREIDAAKNTVDLAAFVLSDMIVIDALVRAEARGVAVRIVLDQRERHEFKALVPLADNVRVKRGGPYLHTKAYVVDGAVLRTGSANFSRSGEREQDNELSLSRDPADAARFEGVFERLWDAGQPLDEFPAAVQAAEPE